MAAAREAWNDEADPRRSPRRHPPPAPAPAPRGRARSGGGRPGPGSRYRRSPRGGGAPPADRDARHPQKLLHRQTQRAGDPARHRPESVGGRVRRHRGRVGFRQIDADEHHRRAGQTHRRRIYAGRGGHPQGGRQRTGRHPQPQDRVRVPDLQPHRPPERAEERGAAHALRRRTRRRAHPPRQGLAGPRGHGRTHPAPAQRTFRRAETARGHCPRHGQRTGADPGRRTYRRAGQRDQPHRHGPVP